MLCPLLVLIHCMPVEDNSEQTQITSLCQLHMEKRPSGIKQNTDYTTSYHSHCTIESLKHANYLPELCMLVFISVSVFATFMLMFISVRTLTLNVLNRPIIGAALGLMVVIIVHAI